MKTLNKFLLEFIAVLGLASCTVTDMRHYVAVVEAESENVKFTLEYVDEINKKKAEYTTVSGSGKIFYEVIYIDIFYSGNQEPLDVISFELNRNEGTGDIKMYVVDYDRIPFAANIEKGDYALTEDDMKWIRGNYREHISLPDGQEKTTLTMQIFE